jgi:hypothetical protein
MLASMTQIDPQAADRNGDVALGRHRGLDAPVGDHPDGMTAAMARLNRSIGDLVAAPGGQNAHIGALAGTYIRMRLAGLYAFVLMFCRTWWLQAG